MWLFEWETEKVEKLSVSNLQLTWLKMLVQTFLIISSDLITHNYKTRVYFVILEDAKQTQQHSCPQEPSREILEQMFHMQ